MLYMNIHSFIHSFLHSFIRSFFHSFRSVSYERFLAPQKPVLQELRTSAPSFNSQSLIFPFGSSSSCLRLLSCLSVIYILPSIFPSINNSPYLKCQSHVLLI